MKKRPYQASCLLTLMAGFAMFFGLALPVFAQAGPPVDELMAGFVYNFSKFVEWPKTSFETDKSPLLVCDWGSSVVSKKLQLLEGREAQGRTLHVKKLENNDDLQGCHILFIGEGDKALRQQIIKSVASLPVLTISNSAGFIEQGGIIGLFVDAQLIRFSVNRNAAQYSGLRLSARMLQLAYNLHQ